MPTLGLHRALAAFELERPRHDRHGERAHLVGQAGDDRRGAGARAAAETGGDEDQVGAGQHLENPFGVFERGRAADVRIRAGAEALRQLPADLHLRRARRCCASACASVLATMNSTSPKPAWTMRFTAFPPPPPTPITLILAPQLRRFLVAAESGSDRDRGECVASM